MEIKRLSYLEKLKGKINKDVLSQLTCEKDKWVNHKGQKEWVDFFSNLPHSSQTQMKSNCNRVEIETLSKLTPEQINEVRNQASKLSPWKKGPFELFGIEIDSEWDSELKWKRVLEAQLNFENKTILDIGCNNGYFMFRMLEKNPSLVLGIDPILPCRHQFEFINHFVKSDKLHFELWGADDVVHFKDSFDIIFYMGILYHHRNPLEQLKFIKEALVSGGQAIIETIGIEGEEEMSLTPREYYAGMKNVYFVPTLNALKNWLSKTGFQEIEVVNISKTDQNEQRSTQWAQKKSLIDGLNPDDHNLTIEGYKAPLRFMLKVTKK